VSDVLGRLGVVKSNVSFDKVDSVCVNNASVLAANSEVVGDELDGPFVLSSNCGTARTAESSSASPIIPSSTELVVVLRLMALMSLMLLMRLVLSVMTSMMHL